MRTEVIKLVLVLVVACKRGGGSDDNASSVLSVDRDDSPETMTTFDRATLDSTSTRFQYGAAGTCRLPRAVLAYGVVGCPVQITRTAHGGTERVPIDYDEEHRLTKYGTQTYEWDGTEVKGGSQAQPGVQLEKVKGRIVEITDHDHHSYLVYRNEKPAEYPEAKQRRERLATDHDAGMLATARSVPRGDWPCSKTVTDPNGVATVTKFVYGPLAACHFPIAFEAEGIVGCPLRMVAVAGGVDGPALPFMYEDDRMIEGTRAVTWREDGVAVDNAGDRFERTANGVKQAQAGATIELAIDDGKLRGVTSHATGTVTTVELSWTGSRLDTITTKLNDRTTTTTLSYDCKP